MSIDKRIRPCVFVAAFGLVIAACGSGADDDSGGGSGGDQAAGGSGAQAGAGGNGGSQLGESCDPYEPRQPPLELFIGPVGLESLIIEHIDAAQLSIDVSMYQFTRWNIRDALIAAHSRGVALRVLLDGAQADVNGQVRTALEGAGIEVKDSPQEFTHFHTKYLIVDRMEALVMSANFITYSMEGERNYGVIDRATDDLTDLQAIFDRDWSGSGALDLSCTRLIVSPENARERLLALIGGAQASLDFASMYISDAEVLAAIKNRAQAGIPTRVLLANPAWIDDNVATAQELEAAGAEAKYFMSLDLHAKLVVADGAAFVGSENLSYTSLNDNREAGVFVTEADALAEVKTQYTADWNAGVSP
jgi:phosphatidylserine/phosphatidylglycerophosphate/cardiolipin synthase-like enzyme